MNRIACYFLTTALAIFCVQLHGVKYSEAVLKKLTLADVKTLLERSAKTKDQELMGQLKNHIEQLEKQEGIVVKGVKKNDIFIRNADGTLKNLEGQELQAAQASTTAIPKGVPVPTTPPAGFLASDGQWQWLKTGQQVVWKAAKDGALVGQQFTAGMAAPEPKQDQVDIAQLQQRITELEGQLALAKAHKPGDILALSPQGKLVAPPEKEQQALQARVMALPLGTERPKVEGLSSDDGYWGWDPAVGKMVYVLEKPGEFVQQRFKPTGQAEPVKVAQSTNEVEQQLKQKIESLEQELVSARSGSADAETLRGRIQDLEKQLKIVHEQPKTEETVRPAEIPSAPGAEGEIPAAPPLESAGEGVPEAPPMDIPVAPSLDIPEIPGAPPVPQEASPTVPGGVAKSIVKKSPGAATTNDHEQSDAVYIQQLQALVDAYGSGMANAVPYLEKTYAMIEVLQKDKRFLADRALKSVIQEFKQWLQANDDAQWLKGVSSGKVQTRESIYRTGYLGTISQQKAIDFIAQLFAKVLLHKDSEGNKKIIHQWAEKFVDQLHALYAKQHVLSDTVALRALAKTVGTYPSPEALTTEAYLQQLQETQKELDDSLEFLRTTLFTTMMKDLEEFAQQGTAAREILSLDDDTQREQEFLKKVYDLEGIFNACVFDVDRTRDQVRSLAKRFLTTIVGLSRKPQQATQIEQYASDELFKIIFCEFNRDQHTLLEALTHLLIHPKYLRYKYLMHNEFTQSAGKAGVEEIKELEKANAIAVLKTKKFLTPTKKPIIFTAIARDLLYGVDPRITNAVEGCLVQFLAAESQKVVAPEQEREKTEFNVAAYLASQLPRITTVVGLAKIIEYVAKKSTDKNTTAMLSNLAMVLNSYPEDIIITVPDIYKQLMTRDFLLAPQGGAAQLDVTQLQEFVRSIDEQVKAIEKSKKTSVSDALKTWVASLKRMQQNPATMWASLGGALTPIAIDTTRQKTQELIKRASTALIVLQVFKPLIVAARKQKTGQSSAGIAQDISARIVNELTRIIDQRDGLVYNAIARDQVDTAVLRTLREKISSVTRRVDDVYTYLQNTVFTSLGSLAENKFGGITKDNLVLVLPEYNLFLDILAMFGKEDFDTFVLALRKLNAGQKAITPDKKDIFALYAPAEKDTYTRYEGRLKDIENTVVSRDYQAVRTAILDFVKKAGLGFENDPRFQTPANTMLDSFLKEDIEKYIKKIKALNEGNVLDVKGLEAAGGGDQRISNRNKALLLKLKGGLQPLLALVSAAVSKGIQGFDLQQYTQAVFKLCNPTHGPIKTILDSMPDKLFEKNKRGYEEWQMLKSVLDYLVDIGIRLQELKFLVQDKKVTVSEKELVGGLKDMQLPVESMKSFGMLARMLYPSLEEFTKMLTQRGRVVLGFQQLLDTLNRYEIVLPLHYQQTLTEAELTVLDPYTKDDIDMLRRLFEAYKAIAEYINRRTVPAGMNKGDVFVAMMDPVAGDTINYKTINDDFITKVIKPAFDKVISGDLDKKIKDVEQRLDALARKKGKSNEEVKQQGAYEIELRELQEKQEALKKTENASQ